MFKFTAIKGYHTHDVYAIVSHNKGPDTIILTEVTLISN